MRQKSLKMWTQIPNSEYFQKSLKIQVGKLRLEVTNLKQVYGANVDFGQQVPLQLPSLKDNPLVVMIPIIINLLINAETSRVFNVSDGRLGIKCLGVLDQQPLEWNFELFLINNQSEIIYNEFLLPLIGVVRQSLSKLDQLLEIITQQQQDIESLKQVVKLSGMKLQDNFTSITEIPRLEFDEVQLLEIKDFGDAFKMMKPTKLKPAIVIENEEVVVKEPVTLSAREHNVEARAKIEKKKEEAKMKSSNKRKKFGL